MASTFSSQQEVTLQLHVWRLHVLSVLARLSPGAPVSPTNEKACHINILSFQDSLANFRFKPPGESFLIKC